MVEIPEEYQRQIKPNFNEVKATQAAVLLLKLNGGLLDYMKLVKLLYDIDREALKRWARPVTFDELYSMPHGLVVSKTLDKAENASPVLRTYWDRHIEARGYQDILQEDAGCDELSPAEIQLISELDRIYKNKTQYDMRDEHHDPAMFPEYKDPSGSRIELTYDALLGELGFPREDIEEIGNQIEETRILRQMK